MFRQCNSVTLLTSNLHRLLFVLFSIFLLLGSSNAQDNSAFPLLNKFSGTIANTPAGTIGVIFALYKDQTGGAPLWQEVKNVTVDANGHYTSVLGTQSSPGIPVDLFSGNEARWLGVQPEGQPEQPRVQLVSVPYAIKALDSETLGGLPASAFVRADASNVNSAAYFNTSAVNAAVGRAVVAAISVSNATPNYVPLFTDAAGDLTNSAIAQANGNIGIGTSSPTQLLHIQNGSLLVNLDASHYFYQVGIQSAAVSDIFGFQIKNTGRNGRDWRLEQGRAVPGTFNITDCSNGCTPRLFINASGYVGIGTTSPTSRLSVAGTINSTVGGFVFPDGSTQTTAATAGGAGVLLTSPDNSITVGGTALAPTAAVNPAVIQTRISGNCNGTAISQINQNGSVTCVDSSTNGQVATNGTIPLVEPGIGPGAAYTAYGDSITAGSGATAPQYRYVNIIAQTQGWALTNMATGGDGLYDQCRNHIWGSTVTASTLSSFLIGQNDGGLIATSGESNSVYAGALQACYLWLLTPNKLMGNTLTQTGTWAADTILPSGIYTTKNSATVSTNVFGSAIYVVTRSLLANNPTFTVTVDGSLYGTYTMSAPFTAHNGSAFAPYLVRIPGLSSTHHAVTVTNQGTGELHIDFITGNEPQLTTTGPMLYASSVYKSASLWEPFETLTNGIIRTAAQQLASDGLGLVLANVEGACANQTAVDANGTAANSLCSLSDGTHPNNAGHAIIANAFLQMMPKNGTVLGTNSEVTTNSGPITNMSNAGKLPDDVTDTSGGSGAPGVSFSDNTRSTTKPIGAIYWTSDATGSTAHIATSNNFNLGANIDALTLDPNGNANVAGKVTANGLPQGCVQLPCVQSTTLLHSQTTSAGGGAVAIRCTTDSLYQAMSVVWLEAAGTSGTVNMQVAGWTLPSSQIWVGGTPLNLSGTVGSAVQWTSLVPCVAGKTILWNAPVSNAAGNPQWGAKLTIVQLQ